MQAVDRDQSKARTLLVPLSWRLGACRGRHAPGCRGRRGHCGRGSSAHLAVDLAVDTEGSGEHTREIVGPVRHDHLVGRRVRVSGPRSRVVVRVREEGQDRGLGQGQGQVQSQGQLQTSPRLECLANSTSHASPSHAATYYASPSYASTCDGSICYGVTRLEFLAISESSPTYFSASRCTIACGGGRGDEG